MPGVLNPPLTRGKPGCLDLRTSCLAEKRLAVGERNAEPCYPVGVLASTGEWPASAHESPTRAGLLRGSYRLSYWRAREGATEAHLFAHGFASAVLTGLVDTGLAISATERIIVGGVERRLVEVTWFRITDRGHKALERSIKA